jgi:hypothetical protein
LIKEYYLDEGKTLEETMQLMADKHGFMERSVGQHQSCLYFRFNPETLIIRQQQKVIQSEIERLGIFEAHINSQATWMLQLANKRKLDNKETLFKLSGQPISRDRIERSAKRAKIVPARQVAESMPFPITPLETSRMTIV